MPGPAFVWSPAYEADIGAHVFRTSKYRETRDRLLAAGILGEEHFMEPRSHDRGFLALVHDAEYLNDLGNLRWTRRTASSELPISRAVVDWFEQAVWGTLTAALEALTRGASFHLGGGFHHAFAGHAEGFCYLNDVAVAARALLRAEDGARAVRSISVVDVDVHQGNGTARIFQGEEEVFTFSIHQENNYPVKEEGDLDIGLEDGAGDDVYLNALDRGLDASVRARGPDVVFYVAGADPYREDQLGGLDLTLDGLRERDRRVFAACREVGAAPVVVLAGGYALRAEDTVTIHTQTAEELLRVWPIIP